MNINIEVIHQEPSRRSFRELMARDIVPDYVVFNATIRFSEIPLKNVTPFDLKSIIKLNDDEFINWDNVAIPRSLFYNLSILHLREYPKGVAHYLVTQNEHKLVKKKYLKNSKKDPDINPYMKTLYKLFYSNLPEIKEL